MVDEPLPPITTDEGGTPEGPLTDDVPDDDEVEPDPAKPE